MTSKAAGPRGGVPHPWSGAPVDRASEGRRRASETQKLARAATAQRKVKSERLMELLMVRVRQVLFPTELAIPPLEGGAIFRAVATETNMTEEHVARAAARAGVWPWQQKHILQAARDKAYGTEEDDVPEDVLDCVYAAHSVCSRPKAREIW